MKKRAYRTTFFLLAILLGLTMWKNDAMALFGTDMPYGERVTDGRFPAVVRIWFPGHTIHCSGVLISPRHILTVAHAAPLTMGEIHDSAWHEAHGGQADDVEEARFSFVGTAEPGDHPEYSATKYWVHPEYDFIPGVNMVNNWDVMILVTEEPIRHVEPVPVLGPGEIGHVQPGAWIRHVSFGPTEGAGIHRYKSTILARVTDARQGEAFLFSMGEAGHGDSGSPVFQLRQDHSGAMHEVLVGILTNEGIRSHLITEDVDNWIREIVNQLDDPDLMPDDYDGDGILNPDDLCMLMYDDLFSIDGDGDGIGDSCDICPETANGGQFDTDEDAVANGCDECPFPTNDLTFEDLVITTAGSNYWTRSPVELKVAGVQSDGCWMQNEYTTRIRILSEETQALGRTADDDGLAVLDLARMEVIHKDNGTPRRPEASGIHVGVAEDNLVIQDNSNIRATSMINNPWSSLMTALWNHGVAFEGLELLLLALPEGELTAEVHIEDGCGTVSETHTIDFGIDNSPPTLDAYHMEASDLVRIGNEFLVHITVADEFSGVDTVSLWLDNPPSEDEFSITRKLHEVSGPWTTGRVNTKRFWLTADFTPGSHTIYVVAKDHVGNERMTSFSLSCYRPFNPLGPFFTPISGK